MKRFAELQMNEFTHHKHVQRQQLKINMSVEIIIRRTLRKQSCDNCRNDFSS